MKDNILPKAADCVKIHKINCDRCRSCGRAFTKKGNIKHMTLKELIKVRNLRGDRDIVIRLNGIEQHYRVWMLTDHPNLLRKHVTQEFYKPKNEVYGVILRP